MTRARQQTARIDSRLEKPTTDRSFVWRGRVSLPLHLSSEGETGRKNEVANGQETHPVGPHRRNSMEKRVCQRSRKSWSGCPLWHCSWWCHGAPPRVTKYRSSWWFVGAPSWGCWPYFSSNAKWRHMTSITESNPARRVIVKGVAV